MKKILLGTTAFVAVGAAAGGAFADNQPIKLGLGGYWEGAGGAIVGQSPCNETSAGLVPQLNNASCNKHHQGFAQDSAIYILGNTKLDNGLTVGVNVQFRGEAASSTLDTEKRSFVQFSGTFGEVRFGDYDDARLQKALSAPQAGHIFGVNSPFFSITGNPVGSNTTNKPVDVKRAHRIGYFSPTIAGFSLAMTYAPDSKKGLFISPGIETSNDAGQNSQAWSVAGAYDGKFGDFHLQAFAATSQTHQESQRGGAFTTPVVSPRAYDGGAQVAYGPFAFGGDYEIVQNARTAGAGSGGGSGLNNHTFDLGASYTVGPFSTSINWSRGTYQGFAGTGSTGVCTAACGNSAHLNTYDLIFDYVLGPGIAVGAALQFDNYTSGVTPALGSAVTNDYHDTVIELGTSLNF